MIPHQAFAIIILVISIIVLAIPSFVSAGLVPCGLSENNPATDINETDPCTICHFFVMVKGILDFLAWTIAPALAVLAVAYGGFLILLSGANPGYKTSGFKAIRTAVIGLIIMLAGWLAVNEVLLYFSNSTQTGETTARILQNPWTEIQCAAK